MLSNGRIHQIVSESINKVLNEVRYIDTSHRSIRGVEKNSWSYENIDDFKKKFSNDCRNYFQWSCIDISNNIYSNSYITFLMSPLNGTNTDKDTLKRAISRIYGLRYKVTYKDKGNGLYVSFYIEGNDNYSPIDKHEKIRVFHGTDIKTAVKIAKNGVSGKEIVPRSYSYESGMNPNGLFVTTDFYQAKEFGYHYDDQVILEFTVDSNELDTPVWNGQSTYFGQNTNPQPFKNRTERTSQKLYYQSNAENSEFPFVSKSDNPAMAEMLMNNDERQALYFGDIQPNQIKRFWYKKRGTNEYVPLSYRQFISKFGNYSYQHTEYGRTSERKIERNKLYRPNEEWNGVEDFVKHCKEYYEGKGWVWDDDNQKYFYDLGNKWEGFGYGNTEPTLSDIEQIKHLLFPKQIISIFGNDRYRDYFDRFYPEWREEGKRV